jgi:GNAT superfamily N-acetyltransferase
MEAGGCGEITYREYQEGDEQEIIGLFNLVFCRNITVRDWNWAFRENPRQRKDIFLAFCGPGLVGQAASVPLGFSFWGEPIQVTRPQNVMVHPDFQNQGIFTELLRRLTMYIDEQHLDLVVTFPNNKSLPTFIRKLDYTHIADIPTYVLPSENVEEGAGGSGTTCRIEEIPLFTPADREFILSCLAPYRIYNSRDLEYLAWRYSRGSGKAYHILRAYRGSSLTGLVVFKLYGEDQSVDLVEFFSRDGTDPVDPWLNAIAGHFQVRGIGIASFNTWLLPHYTQYTLFRKAGFGRSHFITHLVTKSFSPKTSGRSPDSTSFYLSMGDSDVY